MPKERQTLLFSATQTKAIKDLVRLSLKNPEYVAVHADSKDATPTKLVQNFMVVEHEHKINTIYSFIKTHIKSKTIIFLSTCKQVRFYHEMFCRLRPGIPLMALQGKQKQMKRLAIFTKFADTQHAILFATDIAARGLDFPSVNWVVQADCPDDVQTYIHRAGRTARLHNAGKALLVLTPPEVKMIEALEEARIPLEEVHVNTERMHDLKNVLAQQLTKDPELKVVAQKALVSYLRSYHLQKNKAVFNMEVLQEHVDELALSMGLPNAPNIKFGKQKEKGEKGEKGEKKAKKEKIVMDVDSDDSEDDGGEDFLSIKRKNHHLEGAAAEESSEDDEPLPAKPPSKRAKTSRVTKIASGEKLVFDEEGTAMTQLEKFTKSSKMEEADGKLKHNPAEIDTHLEGIKSRMVERDVVDKAAHATRIKQKHRDLKAKLKKRRAEDDDDGGGQVAVLGGGSDVEDDADSGSGESESDEGDSDEDSDDVGDLEDQEALAMKMLAGRN